MAAQLLFGAGNSVAFGAVDGATASSVSCSSATLSNIQVGDLLVALIHSQYSGGGTITPPAGWQACGAAIGSPTDAGSRLTSFFYYPVATSAAITSLPATLTWTFNASSSGRTAGIVARATGIDLSAPFDSASTQFAGAGSTTTVTVPAITTQSSTTLVVGGVYHENSVNTEAPTTTSFMTSFQEYSSSTGSTYASTGLVMGYNYQTLAGSTGDQTITFDTTATSVGGEIVALKALAAPAGPAIVGIPTTFVSNPNTTSFTLAVPAGLEDGDALVVALSAQTPTITTDFACPGWTRISAPFEENPAGHRVVAFYALPVPIAANVTETSFTFTSTDSGVGGRVAAEMFIVRGAELSSFTTAVSGYAPFSQQMPVVLPAMTPTVSGGLMLAAFNTSVTSSVDYTVASGPSGMTEQNFIVTSTSDVSKTTLAVYQLAAGTATISGEGITWAQLPSQASGVGIIIRPKGVFDANNGLEVHYVNVPSKLASARLYYTSTPGTLATPREVRPVPSGYSSVSTMLATTPFYVAHRGGSLDWPEMSLYAYTQSVFWGVGAVELSLARSSDGVWFGLHDASLDRTSLNTGGGSGTTLVASTMTWAQIQAYQIQYPSINNPSSLPQPYMRWEELMDAYYGTHVIFVDPKVAQGYTGELLSMMNAMPDTPTDHFVAKSYGVSGNVANTSGWPHDSAAQGYQTWGYFYDTDYSNVPAYEGRYTILGMNYTATTPNWTQILSYGKPVIGHIVPSSSAAQTALSAGAVGLMVSGVQETITRSPNQSQNF